MRRARTVALAAFAVAVLAVSGCCLCRGPIRYQPLPNSHPDVRARLLAHLGENLFPFWLENCPDREFGGYITVLDRDGSMIGGEKMLVTQARQIWTFARMWKNGYRDPRIREAAELGFTFLVDSFWDNTHEGWFWQVERDGVPADRSKRTYGHAFVIYAMVEYYRAFGDREALRLADLTFRTLERLAKDPDNPGYIDFMTREWQPDPEYNGHIKTMNTHLHLMEAFTELYLVTGDEQHRARLQEVVDILVGKCYQPEYDCCIDGFLYDWTPAGPEDGDFGEHNALTSYGHNVEFAWLLQHAAEALGMPEGTYTDLGLGLIDHALEYGWDEESGALCYEGPWEGPATNRVIEWWTQAENAVALDWAYTVTGDQRYLAALRRQVIWILEEQSDPVYGGWFSTLDTGGDVISESKAHLWHGSYHDVRACLNVGNGRWE